MRYFLCSLIISILIFGCKLSEKSIKSSFYSENKEVNLFAFIGKKISFNEFKRDTIDVEKFIGLDGDTVIQKKIYFDKRFKAKYKIEKLLFNNFKEDTISFLVYDHYGRPKLEEYEYSILYISRSEENKYYLQKYMYDPVKKNKNGTWVGINNESINELFLKKRNGYLKARGIFD